MHMLRVCVHAESIVHGSSHQQAMQKQTNGLASVASGMHMPLTGATWAVTTGIAFAAW